MIFAIDFASFGGSAFYWCNNLESVEMPDSVTEIKYEAFLSCIALKADAHPTDFVVDCVRVYQYNSLLD